jgi:hypothetical protein
MGGRHMIRVLARDEHPDLASLQAPAPPDGVFVSGQDGSAASGAGGRPTLDANHPVDSSPEDLNPLQLEELKATPERPVAKLPETKVPPGKRFGQFVEVTGPERLQKHEPAPVATFNCRKLQFSDLIVPIPEIVWKTLRRKEKTPEQKPSLKSLPEGSPT